jgi:hypothetical protein
MPLSLPRLFAAALVLALGACGDVRPLDDAPAGSDTSAEAGTQATASAPAPAPLDASTKPKPDSCELTHQLEVWSDSSVARRRYGSFLTVQFALLEVASPSSGTPVAPVDTAQATLACRAALEQNMNAFLRAYRQITLATVLTEDFVSKLTEIGPKIGSFADSANRIDPVVDGSANPANSTNAKRPPPEAPTVHQVDVPRVWLAALIAAIAITGVLLGYALRRLGEIIRHSEHELRESQRRHMDGVREKITESTRSLKDDVGKAQVPTLTEMTFSINRVGTEVTMLRERVEESLRGGAGVGASLEEPVHAERYSDGGKETFALDPDPYGNHQWEETAVDVRPVNGGSTSIYADTYGVFNVRWVRDSAVEAQLLVNSRKTLSAAHRDRLDAAFQSEAPRGTGRYHTVQYARCTWDPVTKQGRIIAPGRVEEVG